MKEAVEFPDRAALIAHLQDTGIVMIDGWSPAGFTDGPCS